MRRFGPTLHREVWLACRYADVSPRRRTRGDRAREAPRWRAPRRAPPDTPAPPDGTAPSRDARTRGYSCRRRSLGAPLLVIVDDVPDAFPAAFRELGCEALAALEAHVAELERLG